MAGGAIKACCWENAADPEAVWCPVCGDRLNKCLASAECGGLMDDDGLCVKCVAPEAYLEKGAQLGVKAGGALALPLVIVNPSKRPLAIRNAWVRAGGERRALAMDWSLLRGGANAELGVSTGSLDLQGRTRIDVGFTAATVYQTGTGQREEPFAFVCSIYVDVDKDGGGLVINQTINTAEGATNYMPVRVEGALTSNAGAQLLERTYLPVRRADEYEREQGIRGYGDGPLKGRTVARGATFTFSGFINGQTPAAGAIDTKDGCLRFGRGDVHADGGDNDVFLMIQDKDGKYDAAATDVLSNLHLMMWIEGGRLMARAMGKAGLKVGERVVARDEKVALGPGDLIQLLPKYPDMLALRVKMNSDYGPVTQVAIQREPEARVGS